jgi:hypothetical protein
LPRWLVEPACLPAASLILATEAVVAYTLLDRIAHDSFIDFLANR